MSGAEINRKLKGTSEMKYLYCVANPDTREFLMLTNGKQAKSLARRVNALVRRMRHNNLTWDWPTFALCSDIWIDCRIK